MIENVVTWMTDLMQSLSYLGVMVSVFLETIFPPIPSAFIQPFSGFVASRTDQLLLLTILFAIIGTYLGTLPFYLLGIWGKKFVDTFLIKYGKYLFIEQDEVEKAYEFFEKHGNIVVFFGRLIPIIRTFISFPAGVAKMPFLKFTIYTLLGAGIWSVILATAGYFLGEQWELIIVWITKYENLVIILSILVVLIYIGFKVGKRMKKKRN
jgi:membrane protein DedA with SNARE-associated domain